MPNHLILITVIVVGFEILTTAIVKMAVFWVVMPCSLSIVLMMEAASTSETLLNLYQTTRHYNQKTAIFTVNTV
jgi:hypothetical protein